MRERKEAQGAEGMRNEAEPCIALEMKVGYKTVLSLN